MANIAQFIIKKAIDYRYYWILKCKLIFQHGLVYREWSLAHTQSLPIHIRLGDSLFLVFAMA